MADESAPREPVDVYQLLMIVVEQLDSVGWAKLGLRPDIITGQIHQDLVQARAAIDAMSKVVEVLETVLDDDDKRRVQGMVRDLRINWVEKNKEVGS